MRVSVHIHTPLAPWHCTVCRPTYSTHNVALTSKRAHPPRSPSTAAERRNALASLARASGSARSAGASTTPRRCRKRVAAPPLRRRGDGDGGDGGSGPGSGGGGGGGKGGGVEGGGVEGGGGDGGGGLGGGGDGGGGDGGGRLGGGDEGGVARAAAAKIVAWERDGAVPRSGRAGSTGWDRSRPRSCPERKGVARRQRARRFRRRSSLGARGPARDRHFGFGSLRGAVRAASKI